MNKFNLRLIHWSGKDVTEDHSIDISARKEWPNLGEVIEWLNEMWGEIVDEYFYVQKKADKIRKVASKIDPRCSFYFTLCRTFHPPMKIECVNWGMHEMGKEPPARYNIQARVIVTKDDITIWESVQDHYTWKVKVSGGG